MIGAKNIAVCVARDNPTVVNHVKRADPRTDRRSHRGPKLELHTPPWRYVAGEESALVHWLDDNESLPQYRPQRPHILRIGHGPVLVDNAETCANVGLIGRYGADWFRGLGTHDSPGSDAGVAVGRRGSTRRSSRCPSARRCARSSRPAAPTPTPRPC